MNTARTALLALVAVSFMVPASTAVAQDARPDAPQDARWMAWFGCWEAADNPAEAPGQLLVCFEPAPDAEGVLIRTLEDGELLGEERFVADGVPVPAAEGGCEGERTARWSSDGARVFVSSELRCAEGVTRASSGVMALALNGTEWLEIHAVQAGDREPIVGVRRFVPASAETAQRQGVEPYGAHMRLAVTTARAQASAPLGHPAVAEVVGEAGPDVARALVAEMGEPFALDAGSLKALRDQGVPGDVLDVMVAVTYPERFEIEGASWHAEAAAPVLPAQRAQADWPVTRRGYSPWARDWYGWSSFGYYRARYGPWGYDPYWSPYWGSRIIVVQPSVRDRQRSVHPDRGYTSTRPSTRTATPRTGQQAAPANRPPAASSGNTGTRVTPQGRTGSTSGSDARRATRRTGGGGGG